MISWEHRGRVHAFLTLYLDAANGQTRARQLRIVQEAIRDFHTANSSSNVVLCPGGDRNFAVKPGQHMSAWNTTWHTRADHLQAWADFAHALQFISDTALEEFTFSRKPIDRSGESHYVKRT